MSRPAQTVPLEYPHLFRLLHWVLTVSFVILFLTGLSLHAAARPSWSVFSGVVPSWFWLGRVHLWHYWAAVVFLPAVLVALAFVLQKPFWRRSTHIILTGGGLVTVVTGLWMMYPFGSYTAVKAVVGLHATFGIIVLGGGVLWHIIGGLTTHVAFLVPSFRPLKAPHWRQVAVFVPVAVLTTWIMFEGWPLKAPWRNLVAKRTAATAADDASLASLPWSEATPLTVRLVNGANFNSGQTELILQALHDGNELFVKAQWQDPIANYGYWPWQKTKDGWEYLQTSAKDETVHYEDKFAMVFPMQPSWQYEQVGCAIYCHVDAKYGWGYKGGLPDIDVWHWKSTRLDPVGQVDDKYWSGSDFDRKEVGRYGDPKTGGGYAKNVSEDGAHPLSLPDDPASVYHGSIPKEHALDYTAELAEKIEPGSLIAGVVNAPFEGDRGDVTCVSEHQNGQWTLYIRRKLDTSSSHPDTGSKHDVRFVPGGTYPFGCAAFDCAAKRHAYSKPVFRLVLEQ